MSDKELDLETGTVLSKSFGRRQWITGAAGLGGAAYYLLQTGCSAPQGANVAGPSAGRITITATDATTVETTAGKVRGFTKNSIHTFKGIPRRDAEMCAVISVVGFRLLLAETKKQKKEI